MCEIASEELVSWCWEFESCYCINAKVFVFFLIIIISIKIGLLVERYYRYEINLSSEGFGLESDDSHTKISF